MKIQEVMTTHVESVAPNASLRQAARKMGELKVGSLAVMKDGQLLGLVTDRDISCHAVAMGRDANATDVQKIMIKEVTTCFVDDELADAAKLMADHHIRRLAVVNRDNTLSGWVSVDDLARVSPDLAGTVLEAATPIH